MPLGPEERLRQLLLRTRAAAHGGLSEVHLLLRLRLRQGSVLRLGREGVCGTGFTRPQVRQHKQSGKYLDKNTSGFFAETDKLALLRRDSRLFVSSCCYLSLPSEFLFLLFLLTAYGDLSLWPVRFEIS